MIPTVPTLSSVRAALGGFSRVNPALVVLLGLFNGIMLSNPGNISSTMLCLSCMVLLGLPVFFVSRLDFAKFAVSAVLGWVLGYHSSVLPSGHYGRLLSGGDCGAEIEVLIVDATASGAGADWLPAPGLVKAEVLRLRYSPRDRWRECSGKTLLRFAGREKPAVSYGDVLRLKGAFMVPRATPEGGFDFSSYLKSEKIYRTYEVHGEVEDSEEALAVIPLQVKVFREVLRGRDWLLRGLGEGLDVKSRKILAAILFGCRQGLDYGSRQQFRQSGVMHIFAISGLHVGMLATTLYLVFCWVPFRVRHALVPCFLLLYVFSTGMQSSAVRAFLMIGVWSLHRASLRSVSTLNAVFLAAVLVLFFNPSSYLGAGFQYSFTVAGFLVLSWKSVDGWTGCLNERRRWIPALPGVLGYQAARLRDNALKSLAVSFVAWLAGTGLNLLHRNLFIPGAVLANFVILPFVWLLFPVAGLNILLLPLGRRFGAGQVLELLLRLIDGLSALGAEHGGGRYLVPPPAWALMVFFVCLLVFVTASGRRVFISSGALLFLMLAGCHLVSDMASGKGEMVMFHGDESQIPSFVCIPPGKRGVSVVNIGSPERARSILDCLSARGVNSVDMLYFTGASKDSCNGAWLMFTGTEVRRAVFPSGYRMSRYAKFAVSSAKRAGVDKGWLRTGGGADKSAAIYADAVFHAWSTGREFSFSAFNPLAPFSVSVAEDVNGEKRVKTSSLHREKVFSLMNSSSGSLTYCFP